ncbi:TIGR03086 family metal-binding protein [Mycobacterium hubeiense]|uniref:TIGR03086 family metal-binding protein n=1 Tax=Mycobacterium hubeiense TaxID=1867256 RepID=UPI0018ED73C6|nr:TIGR03086 family metal-binding protein [Mycobacterium sp. QGD 101]
MDESTDIRREHRTAVLASVDVVNTVKHADLALQTPCAGWDLARLLTHMTAQHRGFAAAARGNGADPTIWEEAMWADAVATDPAGAYAAAAADVLDAFAAENMLEAMFTLPDFGPDAKIPGAQAIGFHFVDYVVHGWDVARALGVPFTLPDDVIATALPMVLAIPDGDIRTSEKSPFGLAVAVPEGADDLDRIVAHLGRTPGWSGGRPLQ